MPSPFKRHRKTNTIYTVSKKPILQNKTLIPSKESYCTKNSAWDTFANYSIRILLQKILISLRKQTSTIKVFIQYETLKPKVKLEKLAIEGAFGLG
jgi:hypothetical protein